jgi:hypothetical protein
MPSAWKQYLVERSSSDEISNPTVCPPYVAEVVGRDSANIATAQVLSYGNTLDSFGSERLAAKIRVLERFKGVQSWQVDEIRNVRIAADTENPKAKIQAGSKIFLFAGTGPLNEMQLNPGYDCPALFVNEATLAQVRRGIEEDYSATDPAN